MGIYKQFAYNKSMPPIKYDDVEERFNFAKTRSEELFSLNSGDIAGADGHYRQQLVQEFFFHLLGALDLFAQYVNEQRSMSFDQDQVSIGQIHDKFRATDPLDAAIRALYANPKRTVMPADPYGDDGYLYRAYNYRHQVTHRRRNPFLFRAGNPHLASFIIDPRLPVGNGPNHSIKTYDEEMQAMYKIILQRSLIAKKAT